MQALEHRVPPPIVMIVIAAAMWGVAMVTPRLEIALGWRLVGGAVFMAAAGFFGAPAFRAFGRAGTTVNPVRIDEASALVTSGIYRVTRNPMYVGLAFILLAWAAFLAAPWALIGPVALVAFITRFQIMPEERVLTEKFGDAYRDYCRRVRRWL
jgi:protein-S-isoprenylcysteine O-methyltransferase Ste14